MRVGNLGDTPTRVHAISRQFSVETRAESSDDDTPDFAWRLRNICIADHLSSRSSTSRACTPCRPRSMLRSAFDLVFPVSRSYVCTTMQSLDLVFVQFLILLSSNTAAAPLCFSVLCARSASGGLLPFPVFRRHSVVPSSLPRGACCRRPNLRPPRPCMQSRLDPSAHCQAFLQARQHQQS